MKRILGLLLVGLMAAPAMAQITVDGSRDAGYGGPALVLIGPSGLPSTAVQTVNTEFGNNESEWNAGYGVIDGGRLNLMLTGNLQANFNKLEIFIDSKAGGQSVFDSSGNDNAERMDGLVFDAGFTADYHLIARRGSGKFDLDFANLGAQTFNFYENVFGGTDAGAGNTGTGVNASPIGVAYDGSNMLGVGGGSGAADETAAAAVTTGLELSISLADLGYVGGPLHVMVGQNGDGHHYWSNQFLGGLPAPQGNLGGDGNGNFTGEGAIDFKLFAGNQYFTVVVPEPATLGLGALGCVGLLALRRRK
ncbi:PEP-CTERM sorting domain-containing protein [Lacipirellula limnantheis]|uniref:Ice-binding protein C-terminal domain-containing protein n=1 Tax=Lacipirellula limnantheis TaxID=2528024 RepID=A0A517TZS1_9BACT|nr:PEP-CTERM sorting domain-containing protein [Lacipirellula limnantheis]QDT73879.1 hypothetical protein I41_30700 [Lacipirellula limnantheis]